MLILGMQRMATPSWHLLLYQPPQMPFTSRVRTNTGTFQGGMALSPHAGLLPRSRTIGLFMICLVHGLAFRLAHLVDIIVESGYRDLAFLVVQIGDHLGQHIDGVRHGTTIDAGMQVPVRSGHFHLQIGQSSQARGKWKAPCCREWRYRRSGPYHRPGTFLLLGNFSEFTDPTSSSPSIMNLMLQGNSFPLLHGLERLAACMNSWPLSSQPRVKDGP